MAAILAGLGEPLGWSLGAFWTLDRDAQRLVCKVLWCRKGFDADAFVTATRDSRVRRRRRLSGQGLGARRGRSRCPTSPSCATSRAQRPPRLSGCARGRHPDPRRRRRLRRDGVLRLAPGGAGRRAARGAADRRRAGRPLARPQAGRGKRELERGTAADDPREHAGGRVAEGRRRATGAGQSRVRGDARRALGGRASGTPMEEVFPPGLAAAMRESDELVDELRASRWRSRRRPSWRTASSRTLLSLKFPLVDANGQPSGVCSVSTDITERKLAADALHTAHLHAVETSQAEVRVRGQHEPRAPHAAERRDRHDRAAAQDGPRRGADASTRRWPSVRARRCCA